MLKAALVAAFVAALSAGALADTTNSNSSSGAVSNSGSNSYGNVGNSTTNNMTPIAGAASNANTASSSTSSNLGNTQVIQFITPGPTAEQTAAQARAAQDVAATPTTATVRQEVSGGTDSTQRVEYSGTQTIKNVPSVNGPPLTTSNDTCMGSSSGSINGPGFGVGIGSTWTDRNCVLLKNAREMWNMGMKAAAMALMCTDANNRAALEVTGFVCPQTVAARQAQAEADKQALMARENEQLKAKLSALEGQKAKPVEASTSWFGRRSNPSAEAMLPPPVVPAVAAQPLPVEPKTDAKVQGAAAAVAPAPVPAPVLEAKHEPAPAPAAVEAKQEAVARQDAKLEVVSMPKGVQAPDAAEPTVIRVVSDPKQ